MGARSPALAAGALQLGISLLPEDRHYQGLVLEFPDPGERERSARCCAGWPERRFGMVAAAEATLVESLRRADGVVASGIEQLSDTLCGGNQQKVFSAKWLIRRPRVLLSTTDARHRRRREGGGPPHRVASHDEGVAIILITTMPRR